MHEVFLAVLGLAYLVLVVSTVLVVVLDNRNPVRAMSWVVVLLFLPVVGLVLYFFCQPHQPQVVAGVCGAKFLPGTAGIRFAHQFLPLAQQGSSL